MDPKDGLEITATAALLHFALALQETGVLKEQHSNATHQGVAQAIGDPVGPARVGNVAEGSRSQSNHRFKSQTVYRTHGVSLLLRGTRIELHYSALSADTARPMTAQSAKTFSALCTKIVP